MTMQAYLSALAGAAPFAAELALKGALWLLAILTLTALLRRAPAATRHLVCSLGFAGLFAMPFLLNSLPWRIAVPLAVAPDAHRAQRGLSGDAPSPLAAEAPIERSSLGAALPTPSDAGASAAAGAPDLATALLILWSLGTLLLLVRLGRSLVQVRRILGHARECDDVRLVEMTAQLARRLGIRRPVRVMIAPDAAIPFTAGTIQPVVALPEGARDWPADKREAVLLHELAHVARLDHWTSLAAHAACALYWFNPLAWVASRKMRVEGERACDDAVLRYGTLASDYADQLLQVVRETRNQWAPAVAVAMARRSAFEGRLLAILSPEVNRRRLTLKVALPVALGVALISLPIAAMRAGAAPEASLEPAAVPAGDSSANDTADQNTPSPAAQPQDTLARTAVARSLAVALRDDDERVRAAAVHAIASRKERSVVVDLISLLEDPSVDVRRATAEALSDMPDPRAIAALVQALRSDSDAGVRELAAQALGQIDDERAVPGLTAALRQERVVAVRRKIVWALAEIESPSAAGALTEALRDEDAEVRQYAISGVSSLEIRSAAPQLTALLRDPNADVRARAAHALGDMKIVDALDELMALAGDANADVRQYAIGALGNLEDPRALPAFVRALRDQNVDVRRYAVSAISDVDGLQRAPRELVDALNDADQDVRESAVRALGNIKDASTLNALLPLARSSQPVAIRQAAIEALGEFGGAQVEALLLELMRDPDPKIRRLAAQGLGRE
jgi:HEAT repeat protein/beta-lactamase regulating signal transducer with metallopeptidase domain